MPNITFNRDGLSCQLEFELGRADTPEDAKMRGSTRPVFLYLSVADPPLGDVLAEAWDEVDVSLDMTAEELSEILPSKLDALFRRAVARATDLRSIRASERMVEQRIEEALEHVT